MAISSSIRVKPELRLGEKRSRRGRRISITYPSEAPRSPPRRAMSPVQRSRGTDRGGLATPPEAERARRGRPGSAAAGAGPGPPPWKPGAAWAPLGSSLRGRRLAVRRRTDGLGRALERDPSRSLLGGWERSARSVDPSLCGRRMAAQRNAGRLVCLLGRSPSRFFLSLSEAGKRSARSDDPSLCGRRMAAQRHADRLV
jgi:hypothetical protein